MHWKLTLKSYLNLRKDEMKLEDSEDCDGKHVWEYSWPASHIIVCADEAELSLYNFIIPLRAYYRSIDELRPIVLLVSISFLAKKLKQSTRYWWVYFRLKNNQVKLSLTVFHGFLWCIIYVEHVQVWMICFDLVFFGLTLWLFLIAVTLQCLKKNIWLTPSSWLQQKLFVDCSQQWMLA